MQRRMRFVPELTQRSGDGRECFRDFFGDFGRRLFGFEGFGIGENATQQVQTVRFSDVGQLDGVNLFGRAGEVGVNFRSGRCR